MSIAFFVTSDVHVYIFKEQVDGNAPKE